MSFISDLVSLLTAPPLSIGIPNSLINVMLIDLDTVINVLLLMGAVTLGKPLQTSELHCTDCSGVAKMNQGSGW